MYLAQMKRAIILLIVCLTMVCFCFTMHISATTTSPVEGEIVTGTDVPSDGTETTPPPTTDGGETPVESDPTTSSKGYTDVTIGSPNNTGDVSSYTGTNPNPAISTTSSTIEEKRYVPGTPSRLEEIQGKYSRAFKIGIVVGCVVAAICIFFLIFYNIKAYQWKKKNAKPLDDSSETSKPKKTKKTKEKAKHQAED